ncbi:hypothetical protein N6G94_05070 [Pediococcus inopinatus]|uniref:hypothetical protein n=1 Tax=Pediococcus inopinatus TaxID=114090 RepID=UPI002B2624D2|nr:hypothetical protein [Pediococcus inopinatus]WPC16574.1 hypothetical protein N6G94_05070 [Pediococcus inopinatus]
MYMIPASAFKMVNSFSTDKVKAVTESFTSMRILVGGKEYPTFPKKANSEMVKIGRSFLGLPAAATVEFTQDEMKIHNEKDQVVKNEKIEDFQNVQFGVIRKMGFAARVPFLTSAMTIAIKMQDQSYYILNSDFTPFKELVALFKAQSVNVEDPFNIASLPSNEKRDEYFNKNYEELCKGTNYPVSYGSNYGVKGF